MGLPDWRNKGSGEAQAAHVGYQVDGSAIH